MSTSSLAVFDSTLASGAGLPVPVPWPRPQATGTHVLECVRRYVPAAAGMRHPIRILLLGTGAIAGAVADCLAGDAPLDGVAWRPVEVSGVWAAERRDAVRFGLRYGIPAVVGKAVERALAHVDVLVCSCSERVDVLCLPAADRWMAQRRTPIVVIDFGAPGHADPELLSRDGVCPVRLASSIHGDKRIKFR